MWSPIDNSGHKSQKWGEGRLPFVRNSQEIPFSFTWRLPLFYCSNWYSISGCNVQVAVTLLQVDRNKFHSPGQFVFTNPLLPCQDNKEHCQYEEKVSFGYLELLLGSCNRGGNPRPIFDIYVWGDILPSTQDIRARYDCFYGYMFHYKYDALNEICCCLSKIAQILYRLLYLFIIYLKF